MELKGGRSYRWKIESSGKIGKLVQIALVKRPTNNAYLGDGVQELYGN
jgi:hypothetical protein